MGAFLVKLQEESLFLLNSTQLRKDLLGDNEYMTKMGKLGNG